MNWSKDLGKIAERQGLSLERLCKAVKIELFSGIVSDTRVGDPSTWQSPPPPGYTGGRLRGNWQVQENTPITDEIERIDPEGAAVARDIKRVSSGNGLTYFTNNLPYARTWETRDAMIERNILRVDRNIKRLARGQE